MRGIGKPQSMLAILLLLILCFKVQFHIPLVSLEISEIFSGFLSLSASSF